jgi:hypothetical protein
MSHENNNGDTNMRKTLYITILIISIMMLMGACTSTTLTRVWKDPVFANKPIKSIMVLGIAEKQATEEHFEDIFVSRFGELGIKSEAAYIMIPLSDQLTAVNVKDHKDIIKRIAQQNRMEAVLITHVVSVSEEEVELESSGAGGEAHPYMADLDEYYTFALTQMTAPSRSVVKTFVRLHTSIFDTATEKRIWSAASETVDPKSVDTVIKQLVKAVMDQLEDDGLI